MNDHRMELVVDRHLLRDYELADDEAFTRRAEAGLMRILCDHYAE